MILSQNIIFPTLSLSFSPLHNPKLENRQKLFTQQHPSINPKISIKYLHRNPKKKKVSAT